MKTKQINFWLILKKTIWNLFFRYDTKGSYWFRARPVFFLALMTFFLMSLYGDYQDYKMYSTKYPEYKKLNYSQGKLEELRYGKIRDWKLVQKDGSNIRLQEELLLMERIQKRGFDYQKIDQVQVRWFEMYGGRGWIAEMKINNQLIASYSERKQDYSVRRRDTFSEVFTLASFLLIVALIIAEYRYVKNLLWEIDNG